ncbi:Beta-L-arabinofuranosidase GH127 [Rhizoctonia solani]|uniref:Beta-L-arabinofuranosidase GH127 n=1 Tax=Rhizoctonia solani TaxID=456999 RepID=A0A8H7HFH6_9AGAM|nr:Beta-L-arabinofuranosidase GH127 [Rhizoctonia solani]KAF8752129.1 Beta-L-arabinofuranosidase GH127 [Rhizoctonia solani]
MLRFSGIILVFPHAYVLDSPRLKTIVREFLDHVLDTQWDDGWLGPETDDQWQPRWLWGRYPFLLGAIGMAEAEPELADKIIYSLMKFIKLANKMLREGKGTQDWTKGTRWQDFVLAMQWLHDRRSSHEDRQLLYDTTIRIKSVSTDWRSAFSEERFPKEAVTEWRIYWHGGSLGVNLAEGLKAMAVGYRFSKDKSELAEAIDAWNRIYKYHGRPSGIFAADEFLAGLDPVRGTELCLVVLRATPPWPSGSVQPLLFCMMPSDYSQVERQAYNALPATITGDMWAHQYVQQQNQIAAQTMLPNPFPSDGPEANVFGLEPDYPCCTVNHMQGFPKFVAAAFLKTLDEGGLVQVYNGPFQVETTLRGGNHVSIIVETTYPFGDTLDINITAEHSFDYFINLPHWAVEEKRVVVKVNLRQGLPVDIESGLLRLRANAGNSKFRISYNPPIIVEPRPRDTVALHRGALHYAYDIPRKVKVINRHPNEARAVDLNMTPSGPWQYAIDPSTARYEQISNDVHSPVFDHNGSSNHIAVLACIIKWEIGGQMFANPPPENPECVGPMETIRLIPYGRLVDQIEDQ